MNDGSGSSRRTSRDLARRLPFRHRPAADGFRRFYLLSSTVALIAAVGGWWFFQSSGGERQYLPGPVSGSHASFGDRCESCHTAFAVIADETCMACHASANHHPQQATGPACRSCHLEHVGHEAIDSVTQATCVECHLDLAPHRVGPSEVAPEIASFRQHPEFRHSREGFDDPGQLRFNHAIHLTSPEVDPPLACGDCHQPDERGEHMLPIRFQNYEKRGRVDNVTASRDPDAEPTLRYCIDCHSQVATAVPSPFGRIEPPHASPQAIRQQLETEIYALGLREARRIFRDDRARLPGRPPRQAIDSDSESWIAYRDHWIGEIEAALYAPAPAETDGDRSRRILDIKHCFLCHYATESEHENRLPEIRATNMPKRWMTRAIFSHLRHDALACEACHGKLEESNDTADVNLPGIETCMTCHIDGSPDSAGTRCTLCHDYHREDLAPSHRKQPIVEIDVLKGGSTNSTLHSDAR